MSPETARELTEMMEAVVQGDSGTGQAAQIPGVTVAAKTGTAQTIEGANPHAWFIAFAPAENPQLAVAAPIAKTLMETDRQIRGW